MKTKEQIKIDVINYLTKTSQHIFIKPRPKFIWTVEKSYYEYDYDDFTYMRVFKENGEFFYLEYTIFGYYKVNKINIDLYVERYSNNAKCIISNKLFLDRKMKSIKNNRFTRSSIDEIVNKIKVK